MKLFPAGWAISSIQWSNESFSHKWSAMLQLQMLQAVTKHARRPEYKGKIGLTCLINTDPKVLGFGITSHSYPFVQPTFGVFLGGIARLLAAARQDTTLLMCLSSSVHDKN